jgi:hypothetical protein
MKTSNPCAFAALKMRLEKKTNLTYQLYACTTVEVNLTSFIYYEQVTR